MQTSLIRQMRRIKARVGDVRQYLWRSCQEELRKHEIIDALVKKHGYKRYLEIRTPTTGGRSKIHRRKLEAFHLLMYRCPEDFDILESITYRSNSNSIEHLIAKQPQYDVILVDGWHSYDSAARDLSFAFSLLNPGGVLVAHDCLPPDRDMSCPEFASGCWVGLSYRAYVDFLLAHPELEYYTVDTDYGCGVVHKAPKRPGWQPRHVVSPMARKRWQRESHHSATVFDAFQAHKHELLNLVSVDEFLELEALDMPRNLRLDRLLPQLSKAPF